jgi:hypothetical protein
MQRCHDRLVILVSVTKCADRGVRERLATGVVLTLKARGELDLSQSCSPFSPPERIDAADHGCGGLGQPAGRYPAMAVSRRCGGISAPPA